MIWERNKGVVFYQLLEAQQHLVPMVGEDGDGIYFCCAGIAERFLKSFDLKRGCLQTFYIRISGICFCSGKEISASVSFFFHSVREISGLWFTKLAHPVVCHLREKEKFLNLRIWTIFCSLRLQLTSQSSPCGG